MLSQVLLPRARGNGRLAAFEIMLGTSAIRNVIREGRTDQIRTYIQTGRQHGMQTMDQALEDLVRSGLAHVEDAAPRSGNPDDLRALASLTNNGISRVQVA